MVVCQCHPPRNEGNPLCFADINQCSAVIPAPPSSAVESVMGCARPAHTPDVCPGGCGVDPTLPQWQWAQALPMPILHCPCGCWRAGSCPCAAKGSAQPRGASWVPAVWVIESGCFTQRSRRIRFGMIIPKDFKNKPAASSRSSKQTAQMNVKLTSPSSQSDERNKWKRWQDYITLLIWQILICDKKRTSFTALLLSEILKSMQDMP